MLKVPGTIAKVSTMADRGLSLTVHTQELDPESEAEVMRLKRQLGWFVFAVQDNIEVDDIPTEQIESPNDKTPGQRLRAVFYRLWEQDKQGYKEFEGFYRAKMEKLIESYKEKLI